MTVLNKSSSSEALDEACCCCIFLEINDYLFLEFNYDGDDYKSLNYRMVKLK